MTTRTVRSSDPDTLWLLPPSPRDWLPEDHLAYVLSDLVDELQLTPILATSGGVTRGTAPSHPPLLVKVLLYAYAVGIPASRQIAKKLEEDVGVRVLAANQRPDFRTLSDVRKQHLTALAELFVQVLKRCQRAGLVHVGHIALDGTKVKAKASKHTAMSYGRMVTEEARLTAEVNRLSTQAEAADAQDDAVYGPDRRGDELPAELARREQRLQTMRAAKTVLEQEAQAEAALRQAAQDARPLAKPRRGRPPSPPSSVPSPKAQRNFTDPESRILPASDTKGSVVQGYNCQAAVDARAQIIVAADVTDESNDKPQAQPMLTQVLVNTEQIPRPVTTDAGSFSEANVGALTALGCLPLIPPDRQRHDHAMPAAPRGGPQPTCRVQPGCAAHSARSVGDGSMLGAKRSSSRCSAKSSRAAAIVSSYCAGCGRCGANGRSSVRRTMCSNSGPPCAADANDPATGSGLCAGRRRGRDMEGASPRRQASSHANEPNPSPRP